MLPTNDDLRTLVNHIELAPFQGEQWSVALEKMALFTGGWATQFVGISNAGLLFSMAGGASEDLLHEFYIRDGANPSINPRVDASLNRRGVVSEPDFMTDKERASHPFYVDFLDRIDAPYAGIQTVANVHGANLISAVLRSKRQGPINEEQKIIYENIVLSLTEAAQLQINIEDKAAQIAMSNLDHVLRPAILCNGLGKILVVSSSAEIYFESNEFISQRRGHLIASVHESDEWLQSAIKIASFGNRFSRPASSQVLLKSQYSATLASALVCPLASSAFSFGIGPRVIIFIQNKRKPIASDLLTPLGLTIAEQLIAEFLLSGSTPEQIAIGRGVSIYTVRTQIRAIYEKLEINSLSDLIRRIGHI